MCEDVCGRMGRKNRHLKSIIEERIAHTQVEVKIRKEGMCEVKTIIIDAYERVEEKQVRFKNYLWKEGGNFLRLFKGF